MSAQLNKLLLAGAYICEYRYPTEFALLQDAQTHMDAGAFLGQMDMRLARLGAQGAFFMAPNFISQKDQTQIKNDIAQFRDVYGPQVLMIEYIRSCSTGTVTLVPGEFISLWALEEAVSQSTMVEAKLRNLISVISRASTRYSNRENLQRLMDNLVKDGYLILSSKDQSSYRVTGKVDQLHDMLAFLDENKLIADQEVDDTSETDDLFGDEPSDGGTDGDEASR